MTHDRFLTSERLNALHDGEMSPQETSRALKDLLADDSAQQELESIAITHRQVATALATLDTGLTQHDRKYAARLAERMSSRGNLLRWGPQALAAGMMFAGGVALGSIASDISPWAIPSFVEEASQAHAVFVYDSLRPVELGPDSRDTLADWFSDHLDARVVIPELTATGFAFVGGRLLSADAGPMAQLVYEDGSGERIALYAAQAFDIGSPEVEVVTLDDLDAGYWRQGDVIYTLITEDTTDRVVEIATELGHGPSNGDN